MSDLSHIQAMRHSTAHVLAAAIQKLHPAAQFGVGPVIDNGFYYDVMLPKSLSEEELPRLEQVMQELIKEDLPIEKTEWSLDRAIEYFKDNNQPYKVELLENLQQFGTTQMKDISQAELGIEEVGDKVETVSVYSIGGFVDLCRGPHVERTGQIGAFQLDRLAGAYWRGDEKRDQLQRFYGLAFETSEELDRYLEMREEAIKRDHRKLGKELDLFTFSDLVGPGLPLWTPRGTMIRSQLNNFIQEMRDEFVFEEVTIPHITKKDLYETSGHWDKFKDELFKIKSREGHEFAMKPMNCPHHTQIFDSRLRSYREMPVRYRETTMVYRDEQSGELHGLSRVRSITQDDAHIFCRPSQVEDEVLKVWQIIEQFWGAFGITLGVRLSTHDPAAMDGYLGTPDQWNEAVAQLASVIERQEVECMPGVGEAAFYGPKIDFIGSDALGREFQASTIQLDFNLPRRFDLACIDEKGTREQVTMIHCAIAGSLERSIVLLLEHYAGAFPTWLAPEQVRIIPVSDNSLDYAQTIRKALREVSVRVELDASNESLGKRIRAAELYKVPYTLVVGEREASERQVAVRHYHRGQEGLLGIPEFVEKITTEIKERQ